MLVGIDADKVPAPHHLASVLGGVLAGALAWPLLGPSTAAGWWLVLLPAVTVTAVAATAVAGTLLGRLARRWIRLRQFDETATTWAFRDGRVVFMRNWPVAFRSLLDVTDGDSPPWGRSVSVAYPGRACGAARTSRWRATRGGRGRHRRWSSS